MGGSCGSGIFLEDFLKTVPLFKPLESYDLMQLADCLQQQSLGDLQGPSFLRPSLRLRPSRPIRTLAEGETILKQGDPGDTFYLVEAPYLKETRAERSGDAETKRFSLRGGRPGGHEDAGRWQPGGPVSIKWA